MNNFLPPTRQKATGNLLLSKKLIRFSYLLIFIILSFCIKIKAQVSTYYIWSQSSATYTPGISTTSTTPANIFSTGWDDNIYTGYALPFSFTYNGTAYTNIGLDDDAWITFSNGAPAMTGNTGGGSWVSTSDHTGVYLNGSANNNGFAGFNCDLAEQTFSSFTGTKTSGSPTITGVSSTANLQVGTRLSGTGITDGTVVTAIAGTTVTMSANATTTGSSFTTPRSSIYGFIRGSAPNRQFIIQWTQARRFSGGSNENINFQLVLNEAGGTASLQTLQVVYGTCTTTDASTLDVQAGLRGATSADYNARKSSTGWSTTVSATANTNTVRFSNTIAPASGLTFTWSPCTMPPAAAGSISGPSSVCPSSSGTYTLSAVSGAATYIWSYSGTGVTFPATTGSPTNTLTFGAGATTGNLTVSTSNLCGSGSSSPAFSITVNPIPTASISYSSVYYCINTAGIISVSQTGTGGGTYSSSPAGLSLNSANGDITPSTSASGAYTITYSFSSAGCSNTTTASVTIKDLPNVSVLPASSLICANNNVQLNVYAGTTASYTVASIPFQNTQPSGTPTTIWASYQDDVVSGAIAIPFNFKFYSNTISQLYVYSNGFIQLGTSSGSTTANPQNLPNAANPNNIIALAHADLEVDPSVYPAAKVRYFINGSAPNRVMIIEYIDLDFYSIFTAYGNVSGQIKLYEADNHIEVAVGTVTDDGNTIPKTLGIENSTGTLATTPPGRNYSSWNASTSEAWGFYPTGGSNNYLWSPSTYLSSTTIANPIATNVSSNITYTVQVTDATPGGCTSPGSTTITISAPLNGTYTVGAAGNYPTLTAAVNAYNNVCITGPVTFSLIDALYSTNENYPIVINSNAYASAVNTLTIKPAAGISPLITGAAPAGLIQLKGADYITIDGSNTPGGTSRNLSITNQRGMSDAVLWITSASTSNGATNNTIKNCNIYGNTSSATTCGVLTGSYIMSGMDAEFANSNNSIQNNLFYRTQNAIYQRGKTASPDLNWQITQNNIGSTVAADKMGFRGMAIINSQNFTVSKNIIAGISANTSSTISGISFALNINTGTVTQNKISDVKNSAIAGSNGIYCASTNTASNLTIANNFVFDIASYGLASATSADNGYGVVLDAGGGYKLYYNTVLLNTNQTNTISHRAAAILVSNGITTANSVDLRDNIFGNTQTTGGTNSRYAILSTAANSVYSNIDYNAFYSTGSGYLLCKGTNATQYNTIALLRTNLGSNLNSISVVPTYVSTTDLHLQSIAGNSVISNLGIPITGFTTDYDPQTRNGLTPDMGADEFVVPNYGSWVGKTSTDWLDATNWEANFVPNNSTDVTITGGYTFMPTVITTQAVRGLALSSPVPANTPVLTLNAGVLQVYGDLTRTGGATINGANGTVEMNSSTIAQNIPAAVFQGNNLKNLVIGNTNTATGVTIQGTLDIYRSLTFTAPGKKLTTGGFLTFKSTAAETAWLGDVTGKTVVGNATVERYIPTGINHGKSWQLLAVPVSGTQSVKSSWQEGQMPTVVGPANFGTTISSEKAGATGRGFDFITYAGPSIKSYDPSTNTFIGVDDGISNTSALQIANQKGYMLLVRGDRSVQTSSATATPTTLRTNGKLYTTGVDLPPVTTVLPNKFASIGNPYASAIDFTAITKSAGVDDVFYVWDPLLAGSNSLGGYQTISSAVGYLPTPGSTNYPSGTPVTVLQSGQAFYVHGTAGGNVSFTEAAKIAGSQLVARTAPNPYREMLRLNLYKASISGLGPVDGNAIVFDGHFSNDYESTDALKIPNTSENIGIATHGKILSVESRKPVLSTDTIFYNISNLRQAAYQLRFGPQHIAQPALSAYLVDRYLHISTPVSLADSSFIDFTVTSDPSSSAPGRFFLVFRREATTPQASRNTKEADSKASLNTVKNQPSISIFPNPVIDKIVNVHFINQVAGNYKMKLTDQQGQLLYTKNADIMENESTSIRLNKATPAGTYQLTITGPDQRRETQQVIIK